jgi:hypothetical protein
MVRTIKHYIWKLRAPVQPSGHQLSESEHSKLYYGNYVQPKCNRSDARATPSGCGLVMEAFSVTLERRLQLTIWTLGQAVRTPSCILVIMFYSNIGFRRNWRRWKTNEFLCKIDGPYGHYTRLDGSHLDGNIKHPDGPTKILELLFEQGKSCLSERPRLPSGRVCQRLHFLLKLRLLKPINKGF